MLLVILAAIGWNSRASLFPGLVHGNALVMEDDYKGPETLSIPINPLEEFDFKSKSEIYSIREAHVRQEALLVDGAYSPNQHIFGQIESGKPWWGVDGVLVRGPGQASIEGLSKESQSICNPFLLVTIGESGSYITNSFGSASVAQYFPTALSLDYEPRKRKVHVRYNLSNYISYLHLIRATCLPMHPVTLRAYNARDFGYVFMFIDFSRSSGLQIPGTVRKETEIQQFIHHGGSCGHALGCNNMSPFQPEFDINVWHTPATVTLKLWKEKPSSTSAEPDLLYVIDME
jgi:hypothetical protein